MNIILSCVNNSPVSIANDNEAGSNMENEYYVKVDETKKTNKKEQISDIRNDTMNAISQMDADEFAKLINSKKISPENAIHVLTNRRHKHDYYIFFNLLVNSIENEAIKQQVASKIGIDPKQQTN